MRLSSVAITPNAPTRWGEAGGSRKDTRKISVVRKARLVSNLRDVQFLHIRIGQNFFSARDPGFSQKALVGRAGGSKRLLERAWRDTQRFGNMKAGKLGVIVSCVDQFNRPARHSATAGGPSSIWCHAAQSEAHKTSEMMFYHTHGNVARRYLSAKRFQEAGERRPPFGIEGNRLRLHGMRITNPAHEPILRSDHVKRLVGRRYFNAVRAAIVEKANLARTEMKASAGHENINAGLDRIEKLERVLRSAAFLVMDKKIRCIELDETGSVQFESAVARKELSTARRFDGHRSNRLCGESRKIIEHGIGRAPADRGNPCRQVFSP